MKEEIINGILYGMMGMLNEKQLAELKKLLRIKLFNCEITRQNTELTLYSDYGTHLVEKFIEAKMASGRKKSTCEVYRGKIRDVLCYIGKPVELITEDDINSYLYEYQAHGKAQTISAKNCRAYLSSFFSWLRKNRYIKENPMDLVDSIKVAEKVKQPYTDEDVVALRDNTENIRDLAIMDFLNSSMVRISEMCGLNRDDVIFTDRECVVIGKGSKERVVYFDGQTKTHLQQYLAARTDDSPALFVHLKHSKYIRLKASGVRRMLKNIGNKANVDKVHPHRFRRTGATRCLINGVPLDHVQALLGHTDIKTTQIYAKCNKLAVKNSYMRVYGF